LPAGARPLLNDPGLSPGCALENVYVLPGIPEEMKAIFESVADEFDGSGVSETLYTPAPEGAVTRQLADLREEFDVAVGSYPTTSSEPNRIKVAGDDASEVADAVARLRGSVEILEENGVDIDEADP
ncbi:competence/damage-inducible protein A, partial [Halobium palmae]